MTEWPDKLTAIVAVYAAIVSTGALALEARRWVESGPRLTLTLMPRATIVGGHPPDPATYLSARLTNRGTLPTTVTNYGLHEYASVFHRWFNRAKKSAIVPDPSRYGVGHLPHVLHPGTEWSGSAKYDDDLDKWAKSGKLFVAIYTSHSAKPKLARVKINPRDLDPESDGPPA